MTTYHFVAHSLALMVDVFFLNKFKFPGVYFVIVKNKLYFH